MMNPIILKVRAKEQDSTILITSNPDEGVICVFIKSVLHSYKNYTSCHGNPMKIGLIYQFVGVREVLWVPHSKYRRRQ